MRGTNIICPVCNSTSFKKKNNEGNLLIACEKCGHSAKLSKAGMVNTEISTIDDSSKTFPVKRKKTKNKKKKVFHEISFRIPLPTKKLVQAALFCAKAEAQINGRWYAGASLGNIMADYLSGFDWSLLDKETYQRVEKLLNSVADAINNPDKKAKYYDDIKQDQYRSLSIRQAEKIENIDYED
jgi:DNA-directed RNA polymerase subunit M/transcription elongation factor TFIIS